MSNKFFIPIDRSTIRYNYMKKGPYVVPTKITYEQTNHIKIIGDKIEDGLVVGESHICYKGPITESKDYKEVYYGYPPQPYLYRYKNILVQCDKCWQTFWLDHSPFYKFYDSFHDEHYIDEVNRKCPECMNDAPLDFEYEELDRPTLEKYAAENTKIPPRID